MREFLEEYAFAIISAFAIIILIALANPFGVLTREQLNNTIDDYSEVMEKEENHTATASIEQISNSGDFKIAINSGATTDTYKVEYRIKDHQKGWGNWYQISVLLSAEKIHTGQFTVPIDDGEYIQVRFYDTGRLDGIWTYSNILPYMENKLFT